MPAAPPYAPAPPATKPAAVAGDAFWLGVKMRNEPYQVPPGYAASAINTRFNKGVPETRLGSIVPPWLNKIVGTQVQPWGTVYGFGVFKDPLTKQAYQIIAADGNVYYTRSNNIPQALTLPAGVTITSDVRFEHGTDVLVMLRGDAGNPLVMTSIVEGFKASTKIESWSVTVDHTSNRIGLAAHGFIRGELVRFAGTTEPAGLTFGSNYYVRNVPTADTFTISATDGGTELDLTSNGLAVTMSVLDGTVAMPQSSFGLFAANRLFLIVGDIIYASDALDYTRHTIYNEFRIQQGGPDKLLAIGLFGNTTIIALKQNSVARVSGVYGDLSARQQSSVTERYGIVAPDSLKDVGTDLLWLSQKGVASLSLTEFGEVQAAEGAEAGKPPMFSDDIEPLIKRINWQYADKAVAAYHNDKYYLFVPLDDAEVLAAEMVSQISRYVAGTHKVGGLVVGATYRFTRGANNTDLVNGTDTYTTSRDFVAQGTTVTLNGTTAQLVTDSVKRAFKGVNNACLVFSFQNQAWAGHDEGADLMVKFASIITDNGRERLAYASHDGYIRLYEEDFEEQLAVPYVDVDVAAIPLNATIRVNAGDTITIDAINGSNVGTVWGVAGLANARTNLFTDTAAAAGYYLGSATIWSAPNTIPVKIANGVRFYGTNGVLPTIATTGDNVWYGVTQVNHSSIVSTLVTRGYQITGDISRFHWLEAHVQTWNPSTDYSLITDGVEEELTLVDAKTKDRTKYYYPFDRADFDPTNANNDFLTKGRQDYSILLGGSEVALLYPGNGVMGDLHQESREPFRLPPLRGRMVQLKIVNNQGRLRLMGVRFSDTKPARIPRQ